MKYRFQAPALTSARVRTLAFVVASSLCPVLVNAQDNQDAEQDAEAEDETPAEANEDSSETGGENSRIGTIDVRTTREEINRIGGSAELIEEEDLEALEYDDPHSILLQVPGVYVRQEDGFGLRPNIGLRGTTSDRSRAVTLMEDGVLFGPAPYSAPAAYYFPLMTRMTGVEVFKGPASVVYGPNTIGGAINLRTRDVPEESSGMVDLSFGSYLTGRLHAWYGTRADWGGFVFEGVRWQSDGFKELDGGGDTGFDRTELMFRGQVNTDLDAPDVHRVELKLGYSNENSSETYLGLTDDDFADDPYRRYAGSARDEMQWDRFQYQLRYRFDASADWDLSVTAYRHDFTRSWDKLNRFGGDESLFDILADPTGGRAIYYDILSGAQDTSSSDEQLFVGPNDRTYVSQGVQTRASFRMFGAEFDNELIIGARLHTDSVERDHEERAFDMVSGELVAAGDAVTTTDNRGEATALAAYVQNHFEWRDLTVVPGVRVEWIQTSLENRLADETVDNDTAVVVPGVGVHYAISRSVGVLAGVHRGFSPVAPGQPNDTLPETSINYEAGARYTDGATRVELIGFFNDYNNLVGQCSFSSGCSDEQLDRQFNAGEVNVGGVEVVAEHEVLAGALWTLPLRAAYTFTSGSFASSFESGNPQFGSVEQGFGLPYVPEHQLSAIIGATNGAFTGTASFTYVSSMLEQAGEGGDVPQTDALTLLDLMASYEVIRGGELYVRGDNLLGQSAITSRRPFGARPNRPLMIQGGVRYRF